VTPSGLVITLYVLPPPPTATNFDPDHVTEYQNVDGSADVCPVHVTPSGLFITLYVEPPPTANILFATTLPVPTEITLELVVRLYIVFGILAEIRSI
jgi:hypothetical protein